MNKQLYGRQRIEGESRIVGHFRALWESNRLEEKMEKSVMGQEMVGKQQYCGIKLRIAGRYRELWKTEGRRGWWEGTKDPETAQRIVGNCSSVGNNGGLWDSA